MKNILVLKLTYRPIINYFDLPKTFLLLVSFWDTNWGHNLQDIIKLFHISMQLLLLLNKLILRLTVQLMKEEQLQLAIISSLLENLSNLDEIKENHLIQAGLKEGIASSLAPKSIVWLSYNVHGNEAVGTEAAMKTIYTLSI